MDERGIYEIRKSQIQNFYIESFSDEWLLVVKNLTRKETPSTNSIAIPHAALMRLWEIVSDKITLNEKSRKFQFQGEDAEDLFEKNAIHIESKLYRRTSTHLLTLYTEVLYKKATHEDKVEIYLQKHGDSPINLCVGIRRWKNIKPSKIGVDLKEEMLESLYEKLADLKMLTPPPRKRSLSSLHEEPMTIAAEPATKKKKKEDPTKINMQVQEAYAEVLLKRIFEKTKEYCEKCAAAGIPSLNCRDYLATQIAFPTAENYPIGDTSHKQDCMVHNTFRFSSFHISYVNTDMLAEGNESFKKSMFHELKKNGRLTQAIKSNVENLYHELLHTNLYTSVYLLQVLNRIISNVMNVPLS